jgi:putative zinc finger/helix-turn-helix YgiT family protein
MTRCPRCQGTVTKTIETRPYNECGLSNVVLADVEVRHCAQCGNTALAIPNLSGLHRTIARALAMKPARLLPNELRFMRKYLGLSSSAFADMLGVEDEKVLSWERDETGKNRIPRRFEVAIRLLVRVRQPVTEYPAEQAAQETVPARPAPKKWRMRSSNGGWKAASVSP